MGILKHLLFWPVTGPLFLTEFSLSKVEGVVKEQLTDDSTVKSELLELQLKLELGDITDDEYVEREAELMKQLREIREWREQFGMGVAGGPVRVAQDAKAEADIPEVPADQEEAKEPQVADPKDVSIGLTFDDWHQ
ncbi:MAG: gas vesicle protein GvpG [Gemmatimonadota bacterium]